METQLVEEIEKDRPIYPISIVAEIMGISDQTLRIYEKHGLLNPARRNKTRFYSENDVKWLGCIRDLIHNKKISIAGIKKLLDYAPCWEITDCPEQIKANCVAFIDRSKPCWDLNRMICNRETGKTCEDCIVYMSKQKQNR